MIAFTSSGCQESTFLNSMLRMLIIGQELYSQVEVVTLVVVRSSCSPIDAPTGTPRGRSLYSPATLNTWSWLRRTTTSSTKRKARYAVLSAAVTGLFGILLSSVTPSYGLPGRCFRWLGNVIRRFPLRRGSLFVQAIPVLTVRMSPSQCSGY